MRLAPLEEAGYRALMAVQADFGDRAGAVSTYHRCASVLERELGVVPDEATRATLQRVMGRHQATGEGRSTGPGPDAPGWPLVRWWGGAARAHCCPRCGAAVAAGARARSSSAAAAGVGKSRLVAELAGWHGSPVPWSPRASASARPGGSRSPRWRTGCATPAVQSAAASLEPVWRREVERLVPAGSRTARAASGARAMVDAWQRHRFLEGLARAFLGVGRPTLLVLENLQWCDQETLAFLAFLLGLAPGAPGPAGRHVARRRR